MIDTTGDCCPCKSDPKYVQVKVGIDITNNLMHKNTIKIGDCCPCKSAPANVLIECTKGNIYGQHAVPHHKN